jgi:hypothetical protein
MTMPGSTERLKTALASRYTIVRALGSGGMAVVYLARDQRYDREVALKVLKPDLAAAIGAERFLREIAITARLNHPHILPLLDSGEADGFLYYVMPHVGGGSLRQLMRRTRPLPLDRVSKITEQVASALDHAHRVGVVHRDIKPENILLSEDQAVVADFGIAKAVSVVSHDQLTRSGFPLGTPGYMSPEQAAGIGALDARADVFSLACVAYEMLVGETPGLWPTDEAVRVGRLLDAAPEHRAALDRLPGRIEQTLTRALAVRPADRYATPGAFAAALEEAAAGTARLDAATVDIVLRRAAELDAGAVEEPGALSVGGVEQIAAEVGIPPARVREALAPVDAPQAPPPTPRLRKGMLVVDRRTRGEVPPSAWEEIVAEIQETLGFGGTPSVLGHTLNWHGTKPGFVGRDVRVTVTSHGGETRIQIHEHVTLRGVSFLAPAWGAAGAGLLTIVALKLAGAPESSILLALPVAGGSAVLTADRIIRGLARKYWPELWSLANRLAARVERHVLPAGTPPSIPSAS